MSITSTAQSRPDHYTTLTDILRWRAQHQPDCEAYTFLDDGESVEQSLTYAELDRQARTIAELIQRSGATNQRALLLYPPGLAYVAAFFGCLYADVVAVPAYPPTSARLERTLPRRLRAMVEDARPVLALTTTTLLPIGAALAAQEPVFEALGWLATDALPDAADDWRAPAVRPDALAFLQYTSGSTAAPKGVMLSHANLLHNSSLIERSFGHTPASRGVIWLPPYHDMGLIGGILQTVYTGCPVTLMSPLSFLQRPLRWLEAIARVGATTSGGPNFAYDLCVRRSTPEQRARLDLSSWQVAFTGAEPVRAATLDRFAEAFAPCGFQRASFYPCYGLAEATLIVSGSALADAPRVAAFDSAALEQNQAVPTTDAQPGAYTLVSSGHPLPDLRIVIADPQMGAACAPGRVGEIWLQGPSVAQGYWQRAEQTAQVFGAQLAGTDAGPFLRTGDLGFIHDDELFVAGRLKDLIIIRGRNHYPQDIELTVEASHPALRPGCGAAFAVDVAGEERLVVVQEVERQYRRGDLGSMTRAIRQAIAETHELQVYAVVLVKPGSVPKTSSGKIQRHACRAQFLDQTLDELGRDELPAKDAPALGDVTLSRAALLAAPAEQRPALLTDYLRSLAGRVLHVAPAQLDPQLPLSALGLDSLGAIELQHAVEVELGSSVAMATFLEAPSIAELAAVLATDLLAPPAAAVPALPDSLALAVTDDQPLTPGQRALWLLHQLAPESTAYTIASAVQISGALDLLALHQAFQALVERHPLLRATFSTRQGTPRQQVHASLPVDWEIVEATTWRAEELRARLLAETRRPFDLQHGPLLRVRIFVRAAFEHVLLLTVHHSIADLWSLAVIVRELSALYPAQRAASAAALPVPARRYSDYVRWQAELLAGPRGEQLWQYWRQQLAGAELVLTLPADRPRPAVQTYVGATHAFTLPAALTGQLKALAQAERVTLYMLLLATWQTLLHRYTGQHDFLVGSPTAGRSRAEWADLVGYFVNPIVLRATIVGDPPFTTFLAQVRQTVLQAFAHQDLPFALLVERMQPERDPSRSPLFQVMFVLQKAPGADDAGLSSFALGDAGARLKLGDLPLHSLALDQQVAQFDLTLMVGERDGGLAASLLYNTDLFDAATIARLATHFQTLLAGIVTDPAQALSRLPLLPAQERTRLLLDWNVTAVDYADDERLLARFEQHAARTPDAPAVIFEETRLSYAELNRRANQLGWYLRRLGVGPDTLVGICLDRSPHLVVALLAVLKAGGAFVPLDPTYPQERLQLMIDDARVRALLTEQLVIEQLDPVSLARRGDPIQLIDLDRDWPLIAEQAATDLPARGTPDHLAYAIYTSGSTGRPKGTLVSRRSLLNLCRWYEEHCPLTAQSRVLLTISFSFDASFKNILAPLLVGGQLVLADRGFYDPARLLQVIEAQQVTAINATPSLIHPVIELAAARDYAPLSSLEYLALGGEPMVLARLQPWIDRPHGRCRLFNIYGPTECTDISTSYQLDLARQAALASVPIGAPISNAQTYVLDRQLNLLPAGVAGELCISGAGLARGYLGNPALTAEKFVPHPFAQTPGARLYRTGDLVRRLPDGMLEFLGRIDQQIKLRGYRIELGEIEAALLQHPVVREAVVMVHERVPGEQRLVAFIEPRTENQEPIDPRPPIPAPQSLITPSELRRFLLTTLPDYMVPAALVVLDALPLTPSGKLDRQALLRSATLAEQAGAAQTAVFVAPESEMEQRIAGIWQEVLQLEAVGLHDNFFDLGGHSLLMAQVHSKLQQLYARPISMIELFKYPTVQTLAQHLSQSSDPAAAEQQQAAADDRLKEGRNRLKEQRKQRQRLRDS